MCFNYMYIKSVICYLGVEDKNVKMINSDINL